MSIAQRTISDIDPVACKPHRRQFIVGPQPHKLMGWSAREISHNHWISHCPELRVSRAVDRDGAIWHLLGLVTESLPDRPDPCDLIAGLCTAEVPKNYDAWTGRWVLVGDGCVHPDGGALLGVFYGRSRPGQVWASSSPALLVGLLELDSSPPDQQALRHERGISWYPPPWSRMQGLSRLLPSQVLDLRTGDARSRRLLPPPRTDVPYEQALEEWSDALVESIRRLPLGSLPIWLSLSAGGDSRLVFAAAHAAGVEMRAFTRVSTRMSVADYVLPAQIAADMGYEHGYVSPTHHVLSERMNLVFEHCSRNVSRGDAQPVLEGHRDTLRGISLGGQGFGVGKLLMRKNTEREYASSGALVSAILNMMGEQPDSYRARAMHAWADWLRQTPVGGLDWRDRFYLEQRTAGWQSAKEQVYDMQPHERFFPINSARTYSLLLSMPEHRRMASGHHRDAIRLLAPALDRYPYNPPERYFGMMRAIGLHLARIQSWRNPRYIFRRIVRLMKR